jgi:acetolactate synthase-1/2/3 large subunit
LEFPAKAIWPCLDGFHLYRERIQFVVNRQEGGAAFMAEAHGKLTGRPGVCFVTRGPGATNACIGVHTAFQDSTPMVLLIGDVASDQRDREAFQEMDYRVMFGPSALGMAKRVERIDDAERIPEYIARAFATAMNGRPGPVVLGAARRHADASRPGEPAHRRSCPHPWPASNRRTHGATPAPCARCVRCS